MSECWREDQIETILFSPQSEKITHLLVFVWEFGLFPSCTSLFLSMLYLIFSTCWILKHFTELSRTLHFLIERGLLLSFFHLFLCQIMKFEDALNFLAVWDLCSAGSDGILYHIISICLYFLYRQQSFHWTCMPMESTEVLHWRFKNMHFWFIVSFFVVVQNVFSLIKYSEFP